MVGEVLGTLSTNIMNRVAQKFILVFRNRVYHKLQSQSLGYLQRQRIGDLISRAIGDVDEIQSFIVNGIDVIVGEGLTWIATVVLVHAAGLAGRVRGNRAAGARLFSAAATSMPASSRSTPPCASGRRM